MLMRSSIAEQGLAEIVQRLAGGIAGLLGGVHGGIASLLGGVDRALAQLLRALADAVGRGAEPFLDLLTGGRLLRLGPRGGGADAGIAAAVAFAQPGHRGE